MDPLINQDASPIIIIIKIIFDMLVIIIISMKLGICMKFPTYLNHKRLTPYNMHTCT